MIGMRFDTSSAEAAFQRLEDRAPQAIARALNRAITSARVVMRRAMATDLGLKQGAVDKQFFVLNARPDKLKASLEVRGKRIPLIEFGARGPEPSRGKGRGVTARLPGGKGRYPHAFIATMRSGHRGVFQRVRGTRLPIVELRGPSLPRVFRKYQAAGLQRGEEALRTNLEHELQFAMRQAETAA